jgi:hypothetical protein
LNVGESFFDLVIGNWDVERRKKFGNEQSTGFNGFTRWMLRKEVKTLNPEVSAKKTAIRVSVTSGS